jgi:hypothetical protein
MYGIYLSCPYVGVVNAQHKYKNRTLTSECYVNIIHDVTVSRATRPRVVTVSRVERHLRF